MSSFDNRKKDYPDFDEYEEFDFTKEGQVNKYKKLNKGQRLIQKLRFIMKFKNKSELFQRIQKGGEVKDAEKSGYSTGALIRLYPDIRLLDNNGEIDKLSRLRSFSSELIIDAERIVWPLSEFFLYVLRDSLDFEENYKMMKTLDIDQKDQTFLLEMLCDYDCIIIQHIFMVFYAIYNKIKIFY